MFFGNWYRRVQDMPQQVAVGVQFLIGYDDGNSDGPVYSREQWKAAARSFGLFYFIQAPPDDATMELEATDPYLLGYDQKDEPNNDTGNGVVPIATLRANYKKWTACWAQHGVKKLVMLNYDGWQQWSGFDYNAASAPEDPTAHLFMVDYYVRNRNGPNASITADMGEVIRRHKSYLHPGQLFGFFLETDDQLLKEQGWAPSGCGPTLADIAEYFELAKAYGVDVIGLFEDVIGRGFVNYGATTAAMYETIRNCFLTNGTPIQQLIAGTPVPHIPAPTPSPTATPAVVTSVAPVPTPLPIVTTIHQRTAIHFSVKPGRSTIVTYDDGSTSRLVTPVSPN